MRSRPLSVMSRLRGIVLTPLSAERTSAVLVKREAMPRPRNPGSVQRVPANELDDFNAHIVGEIEVVHELR